MNVSGCVSAVRSSDPFCKGDLKFTNTCGKAVACHYTTSDGKSGCVYPSVGTSDCIAQVGTASYTLTCADGQLACDQAIGCGL
jgi:hypothetical protein